MDSERQLVRTTAPHHLHEAAAAPIVDPLDDAAPATHVGGLRRREWAPSDRRTVQLGHLDRLRAALVERYRVGCAGNGEVAFTLDGS
jgi:hypothetical protein